MKDLIRKVTSGEAYDTMYAILDGTNYKEIKKFLIDKQEVSVDELVGFAGCMKDRAKNINPDIDGILLDTCGTGGDCKGTINASTGAALIASAAGIYVAKHGNYSVSSNSGSANVMKELGYNLELAPEAVKDMIEKEGFGFCFAPKFHPAMKNVADIRKQIKEETGKSTIFNLLGPLCNPANAKAQLIGVYDKNLCEKFCYALRKLGSERAMVIHGSGLDEISNIGETTICELNDGNITSYTISPESLGFKRYNLKDIRCSSPEESAKYLRAVFNGEKGARRDILVLNAGAGICLADGARTLKEGIKKAEEALNSGAVSEKLSRIIEYSNR